MSNEEDLMTMGQVEKYSLVPKLRFPEFRDAGEWEEKSLVKVASVVSG
jgi:type I restriction enzyme S subunit